MLWMKRMGKGVVGVCGRWPQILVAALAMTALARLSDNVVLSGSASYGMRTDVNQFGGRVGAQVAW